MPGGIIGGQTLEPRVIGGGLAALGSAPGGATFGNAMYGAGMGGSLNAAIGGSSYPVTVQGGSYGMYGASPTVTSAGQGGSYLGMVGGGVYPGAGDWANGVMGGSLRASAPQLPGYAMSASYSPTILPPGGSLRAPAAAQMSGASPTFAPVRSPEPQVFMRTPGIAGRSAAVPTFEQAPIFVETLQQQEVAYVDIARPDMTSPQIARAVTMGMPGGSWTPSLGAPRQAKVLSGGIGGAQSSDSYAAPMQMRADPMQMRVEPMQMRTEPMQMRTEPMQMRAEASPVVYPSPVLQQMQQQSMFDDGTVVASRVVSRQEMAAAGHVVRPQRQGPAPYGAAPAEVRSVPTEVLPFRDQQVLPSTQQVFPQSLPTNTVFPQSATMPMGTAQYMDAPLPMTGVVPTTILNGFPPATSPIPTSLNVPNMQQAVDPGDVQAKCSILSIPDEYMAHISQEDLSQIQEMTGSTIQFSQPDAAIGRTEWEIRLFGSEDARRQGHEILENTLNERLLGDAGDTGELQASNMAIPDSCMKLFCQEDFEHIKEITGCQIEVYAPDQNGTSTDWQVSVTGTTDAIDQANLIVQNTLQERMAEQSQDIMPPESQEMLPSVAPATTEMVPLSMGETQQSADKALDMPPAPEQTTVLPIPADYVGMLTQEDINSLEQQIGVTIVIAEPEPGTEDWSFTLHGSEEQRESCHRSIEELLSQRQEEMLLSQGQIPPTQPTVDAEATMPTTMLDAPAEVISDDQSGLVPCTVLPIPYEYLRTLYNLDPIQEVTGATIKVSPPESGAENGDWQLSLFGTPTQRQQAHQAIEATINDSLNPQGQEQAPPTAPEPYDAAPDVKPVAGAAGRLQRAGFAV